MYMLKIPFSAVTEGEYIFKGSYSRKLNTLLSKQFGYTTTTGKWAEVEGVKASKEGYGTIY